MLWARTPVSLELLKTKSFTTWKQQGSFCPAPFRFNSFSGEHFTHPPLCRAQFWSGPPASAASGRSWRLECWWCCRRSRPAAPGGRPPASSPDSSPLLGRDSRSHPAASESNERSDEENRFIKVVGYTVDIMVADLWPISLTFKS